MRVQRVTSGFQLHIVTDCQIALKYMIGVDETRLYAEPMQYRISRDEPISCEVQTALNMYTWHACSVLRSADKMATRNDRYNKQCILILFVTVVLYSIVFQTLLQIKFTNKTALIDFQLHDLI